MVQLDSEGGDVVLTVHLLGPQSSGSTLTLLSECRICFGFALFGNFAVLSFLKMESLPVCVHM